MKITAVKTRVFEEGNDLVGFILDYVPELKEGSVLVVTSKIVALAEGRTDADVSPENREKIIKTESQVAIKTEYEGNWLTIARGMIMTSAGIDQSNGKGKLILLPKDSYATADQLRKELKRRWKINELGIVITDSRVLPMRAGALGMSIGYAGLKAFKDYRGKADMFGRKFVFETSNIPDALAAAAVLEMGEGAEQQPLAIIEHANIEFSDRIKRGDLEIDKDKDLYKPLLDFTKADE